jgi:RimJ/RimL family protein N-acetyltransferase
MKYQDQTLIIRNADLDDVDCLIKWWSDGKVMAHAGFPNGIKVSKNELEKRIQNLNQAHQKNEQLIIIEYEKIKIGEMHYRISEVGANIGIKICEFNYHHQGLGTRALKLLIHYLFNEQNVNRIYLDTNLKNINAQKTYEKLGFTKIVIRQDIFVDQLGQKQSCVDYEMLKKNDLT